MIKYGRIRSDQNKSHSILFTLFLSYFIAIIISISATCILIQLRFSFLFYVFFCLFLLFFFLIPQVYNSKQAGT